MNYLDYVRKLEKVYPDMNGREALVSEEFRCQTGKTPRLADSSTLFESGLLTRALHIRGCRGASWSELEYFLFAASDENDADALREVIHARSVDGVDPIVLLEDYIDSDGKFYL